MKSILFVCTGNICRSPTADGIFRHIARQKGDDWLVDSAGTHGYHVGDVPDSRAIDVALRHGVDLSVLSARKFTADDFNSFDHVIAMDNGHKTAMENAGRSAGIANVRVDLFLDYLSGHKGQDVPDPYYGSIKDFERVYDLIDHGTREIYKALS